MPHCALKMTTNDLKNSTAGFRLYNKELLVWLVQIGEPLPVNSAVRRQRLTLLSEALVARGHKIVRWGSKFDHVTKKMITGPNELKFHDGKLMIHMIKGCGYKRNISLTRILDHWLIENRMIKKMNKIPNHLLPNVILVCSPTHSLACRIVKFAKLKKIPVIVDIRDQWPDIFFNLLPKTLYFTKNIIFYREISKFQWALKNATSITAMMEDLLQWGLQYAQRSQTINDKVFYIGSPEPANYKHSDLPEHIRAVKKIAKNKLVFCFVGTFSNACNPNIIAEAARILAERDNILFLVAGGGNTADNFEREIKGLRNIKMLGWLTSSQITAVLEESDVGIIPLSEERPCFPNKAFIYFSAQLPIITSTPGELNRIVDDFHIGLTYNPNDLMGLVEAIKFLADNPEQVNSMKNNVKEIYLKKFDGYLIYQNFAAHIENVARGF